MTMMDFGALFVFHESIAVFVRSIVYGEVIRSYSVS